MERQHNYEKPRTEVSKQEHKKFTGILTQAAKENSKIKPTKNYL
jgi:hypothetical protein